MSQKYFSPDPNRPKEQESSLVLSALVSNLATNLVQSLGFYVHTLFVWAGLQGPTTSQKFLSATSLSFTGSISKHRL